MTNYKRKLSLFVMFGELFIACIFLTGCQNLELKGELKGNDRGAKNEFRIKNNVTENVSVISKISQPYNRDIIILPEYTETGLEILLW